MRPKQTALIGKMAQESIADADCGALYSGPCFVGLRLPAVNEIVGRPGARNQHLDTWQTHS